MPAAMAPTTKTTAFATVTPISMPDRALPLSAAVATAATTASTSRPSTSSITAAPSTMRASGVWTLPRSLKTRAVIPTLVAQRTVPMNACS